MGWFFDDDDWNGLDDAGNRAYDAASQLLDSWTYTPSELREDVTNAADRVLKEAQEARQDVLDATVEGAKGAAFAFGATQVIFGGTLLIGAGVAYYTRDSWLPAAKAFLGIR